MDTLFTHGHFLSLSALPLSRFYTFDLFLSIAALPDCSPLVFLALFQMPAKQQNLTILLILLLVFVQKREMSLLPPSSVYITMRFVTKCVQRTVQCTVL